MSNEPEKPKNALALTGAMLNAPARLADVFELEPLQKNWVGNRVKTTGEPEEKAAMIFEREKLLFLKAVSTNKQLEKCDRFSIYSAFIELAVSGVSLNDGEAYIIPYGQKATFQIGYKGRVNQIQSLPGIQYVQMPQVVYDVDDFDYTLGERPRILKHKPGKRTDDSIITHVYMVIERDPSRTGSPIFDTYVMTRDEVLAIRDRYSQSYKQYLADCKELKKEIGSTFTKRVTLKDGRSWDQTVEPPMWITAEAEAFKKTIVKRAYKWVPKTARMKALDARIESNPDPETGEATEEVHDIDYGIHDDSEHPAATDQSGTEPEVTPSAEPDPSETKTKRQAKRKGARLEPSAAEDIDDIAGADTSEGQSAPNIADDIGDPLEEF